MADTAPPVSTEASAPAAAPSPKKAKAPKKAAGEGKKAGRPKSDVKTPAHPPTATLVNEAIGKLNEKGGSSLQAIKKYISETHKLDAEKLAPFIRKYLKSAVIKGALLQPKGKGAAGSFKLAVKPKAAKKPAGEKKLKVKKA